MKKHSERCKDCMLAVVRQSQNFSPHHRPLPGAQDGQNLIGWTTFIYKPSLVKIDARNFELSW